ncbi:MAG: FlgD immunoglobulin-like domain containing protein, partial [Planctomycetia bacterium]
MKKQNVPFFLLTLAILFSLAGPAAAAPPADGADISYQLDRPMRVSINVYDSKGEIVRSLLSGAPRQQGQHRERWDGRDREGNPVPPGDYSWKLLAMPGRLKTEYLLTAATNYPDPAPDRMQETEHYRLVAPGTHGGPIAVAADESGVSIGASCTENIENYLVKLSPDGSRRLWSKMQRVPWKGAVAVAKSGDRLLVLSANNEIWPYAAADGKDLPAIATSLPPLDKDKPDDAGRHAAGLAANDREMVLCYPARGLVRWCDPADGRLLREVGGLDKPAAVAIAADGTTYAICGTSILRLDQKGSAHATVVSGLGKPTRIAVDTKGELLVYDAAPKQVLRFGVDGKRLAAFGREGGRRDGTYDQAAKESFHDLGAVAAALGGGFLVAEPDTAPRRVARFTAEGRCEQEWYGGHVWAPWIAVDPENPGTVFMPSSWNSIMRLAVDLKNKTWSVRAVYQLDRMADGMLQGHANALVYRAFRRDGRLFIAGSNSQVFRVEDEGDRLVPATAIDLHMSHDANGKRGPVKEWAEKGSDSFQWNDANGDGRAQRDEVRYFAAGPWTCLPEWDASGMYAVADGFMRWPITGLTAAGAPVLGEFPAGKTLLKLPPRVKSTEPRWASYITADPTSGGWYVAINSDMKNWGQSTDSFLIAYNADGSQRWITVGKTIGTPQTHIAPGEIGCFRRIAGTTHDCVVINDFMEGPSPLTSYVWDRDGLWVGGVMDEIDRKAAPAWRYGAGGESLGTTLVNDPKTGDVLLYWHGLNDLRIGKVTGWEGWQRKAGTVKLVAPGAATQPPLTEVPPGTGKGLRLEFWDQSKPDQKDPAVVRLTDLAKESWGESGGPDGLRIRGNGRVARVTGEIEAYQTGWHSFSADIYPSKTHYRIAGVELGRFSHNEIYMEAGKRYPVEILYDAEMTHPTTNQGIRIKWATPRGTWPGAFTPIPV